MTSHKIQLHIPHRTHSTCSRETFGLSSMWAALRGALPSPAAKPCLFQAWLLIVKESRAASVAAIPEALQETPDAVSGRQHCTQHAGNLVYCQQRCAAVALPAATMLSMSNNTQSVQAILPTQPLSPLRRLSAAQQIWHA